MPRTWRGEAFLRLPLQSPSGPENRTEFLAYVVRIMRNVLIDRARRRLRNKRQAVLVDLDAAQVAGTPADAPSEEDQVAALLDLTDGLGALAREYPREARILELRYWVGAE